MNAQNAGRFISIYQWNYTVADQWITGVWNRGYQTLYRINKLLIDVAAIEDVIDEAERDQIIGQALVMRALIYFEMVNYFGQTYSYDGTATHYGVPLVTEPIGPDENPGRAMVSDIYDQILLDLEGDGTTPGAIDLLSSGTDPFTININAAKALLSRVYLYMVDPESTTTGESAANLQKASDYATDVINSGQYSLIPQAHYKDSWTLDSYDQHAEQIFYLKFTEVDNWSVDMIGSMYMETGYGDILATNDLLSLYDDDDVRLELFRESDGLNFIEKYPGRRADYTIPENEVNVAINNTPIFRFAEMYLNAAEAQALLGNNEAAATLLSAITTRAGAAPVLETGADLISRVKVERRKELCFEGQRLWDLQRWHENVERTDLTSPNIISEVEYGSYLYAYPIPDREIQANPVIAEQQNPGY